MKLFKRGFAACLCAVMLCAVTCSCGNETKEPSREQADHREPMKTESVNTERFIDTDGDFEYKTEKWSGPEGYVIVVPQGDKHANCLAQYFRDYYTRVHGVTLKISTDSSAETSKEILIGKTNRKESKSQLAENEIKASLNGEKLVFEGGHYATVEVAVKRFLRLMPDKNEAFTFYLTTDFTASPNIEGMENYKYVWGDEFEEWYDVDFGKWSFHKSMTETTQRIMSTDRRVIDIGDGRLKMRAINYFTPNDINAMFLVPYATATIDTMNYLYGYAEIRARVPFMKGVWPSFWGTTKTGICSYDTRWSAEVDVFEIFGSNNKVVPNIHKWYGDYDYAAIYGTNVDHTQYKGTYYLKTPYEYENYENLCNEYHTYGYEWTPTRMHFYVDGEKYCTFDTENSFDLNPDMSMFREPQFLMFNCHVFTEDSTYKPNLIYDSMEKLPAEYFVDYFRLYQISDGKSKLWTDTSARFTEPENRVKPIEDFKS